MQTEEQYLKLPDAQEKLFCKQYIIDFNATAAVIRAGYKEDGADLRGEYLLGRPELKTYIRQLLNNRGRKFEITAERVLQELAWIAYARTDDFTVEDSPGARPEHAPKATGPANCSITHNDGKTGRKVVYQFNVRVKIQALKLLGKHLGVFEKDINDFLKSAKFIFPPVALK